MRNRENNIILQGILIIIFTIVVYASEEDATIRDAFTPKRIPGLPDFVTINIMQDRQGFIWFATEGGLYRYGGNHARPFWSTTRDSTVLTSGLITKVFEDSHNHYWVATNHAGVNRIDAVTGKVNRFLHDPHDSTSISHNMVHYVFESGKGQIWLRTLNGFDRLNCSNDKANTGRPAVQRYTARECLLNKPFYGLPPDQRKRLKLYGWRNGLLLYDAFSDHFYNASLPDTCSISGKIWTPIFDNHRQKYLWLLDEQKRLYKIYRDTARIEHWDLSAELGELSKIRIYRLGIEKEGTIWILTKGLGAYRIETETGEVSHFYDTGDQRRTLNGNMCYAFMVDRDNDIWLSTEKGIQILQQRRPTFAHIQPLPNDNDSGANRINYIYHDQNGRLWLSGYLQMHWYIPKTNKLIPRIHKNIFPDSLQNRLVRSMIQDRGGRFWFGTMNGALWYADSLLKDFGRIQTHFGDQTMVRDIIQDKSGALWFGVDFIRGKLLQLNPKNGNMRIYQRRTGVSGSLSSDQITRIFIDSRNRFWIGTWGGGVNLFEPVSGKSRRFRSHPQKRNSISDNMVTDIQETRDGTLWISTWGGGLNRVVERKNGDIAFQRYNTDQGLPMDAILCLLPDDNNRLWIASEKYISMYDTDRDRIVTFTQREGIRNSEFFMGARETDSSGRLYFGGAEGVTVFHPDSVFKSRDSLKIYISDFRVFNRTVTFDTLIPYKNSFRVSHDQHFVSIAFNALELEEPQAVEYAYRLKGLDSTWIPVKGKTVVNLTRLPYGDYQLQIKARKYSSEWQGFRTVKLAVIPPFWMRPWFLILSAILFLMFLITGIWMLSRYRLKRRLQALQVKQRLHNERERISRELHDHVGAKLTNIVTGLEIAQLYTKQGARDTAVERIHLIESHARSTIRDLRETIWSLKYNASSLSMLVNQIQAFIHEQMPFQNGVKIRCHYNEQHDIRLSPMQALNLFRITQESVMNALKHASPSCISVNVETPSVNTISICVRDDGRGFDVEAECGDGNGFGLKTIQQRAQKIGARLHFRSESENGTEVFVRLSISKTKTQQNHHNR